MEAMSKCPSAEMVQSTYPFLQRVNDMVHYVNGIVRKREVIASILGRIDFSEISKDVRGSMSVVSVSVG